MTYDAEQIYDKRINPLMAQIIAICKEAGIPIFATFQLNNNGDDPTGSGETMMCTSAISNQPYADEVFKRLNHELTHKPFVAAITITKQEPSR